MKCFAGKRYCLHIAFALAVAVSFVSGIWVSGAFHAAPRGVEAHIPQDASVRLFEPPEPLQNFTLTDHNGQQFNTARLLGYWTFIFFGYTNCPDVCPMALIDLNAVYENLESQYQLGNTRVVFVSVDPVRDSLRHLDEYVGYFNEDYTGVTGNRQQLSSFAKQFGVVFKSYAKDKKDDDYLVDHTASIMLVDHYGRLVAVFPPPHDPEAITSEFLSLRERYGDGYDCIVDNE